MTIKEIAEIIDGKVILPEQGMLQVQSKKFFVS